MKSDLIYFPSELRHGICRCCGKESDEIIKETGVCTECMELNYG